MSRKKWVLGGLAAISLLIGVAVCLSQSSRPPARLVAFDGQGSELWPISRAWVWEVDPVAGQRQIGVCVRTTESKIPPGTNPTIEFAPKLAAKGVETHTGWFGGGNQRLAAQITCQVIDLREVTLQGTADKQPLRLLVRMQRGGSRMGISGRDSVLAGETLAGHSVSEPRWSGDELHLLTVYSQTDDTLFTHYVLVQHRADE